MWTIINPINLIRYLIAWKVNRSLIWLPSCLSVELSLVLGSLIADRLPTHEARPWRKAMVGWEKYVDLPQSKRRKASIPEIAWPIEVVLFTYPGKLTYGQDELVFWELKLVGNSADHGFFLEVILPAIEEASSTIDPRWHRQNSLWGRFDIQAVYVARGPRWEPLVCDGKLDLRYRATPTQWAEGLTLGPDSERTLDRLTWLTPFDLPLAGSRRNGRKKRSRQAPQVPTLAQILESLVARLSAFIPGKRGASADVWDTLSVEDQASLRDAIEQAARFPRRRHTIERAPKGCPGQWIGAQTFLFIPDSNLPYLELASILHLGKQTHFGCGTFVID